MDVRNYMPAGDPKKILGTVISISVVLLVIWLFAVSRMEYRSGPAPDTATEERKESVQNIMNSRDGEQVAPGDRESSRIFLNALTTFAVMLVLLAAVWIWSRKKSGFHFAGKHFREIAQHTVAPGQQLKILEINREVWVLGIGSGGITLLHRYPADQWKEPDFPAPTPSGESQFYKLFSGKS